MLDIRSATEPLHKNSFIAHIGNTPLLRLRHAARLHHNADVEIYAKAEWFNPGGSVKDRAALHMIRDGEQRGLLTPEKILIDATSGNTGIAYAMIGSALGYRVQLAIPANASKARLAILRAYGAEITLTDPLEGTDGAQHVVIELVNNNPEKYFYPDQYNNPANWQAHYLTTASEIYAQTNGRLTHFVAGLGTTGTFVGTARRLKELVQGIQCIAVQPDSPLHALEGLKHLPTALVPGIYDSRLADRVAEVSTEHAFELVKFLAREEGLLVGNSSGAALVAAIEVAETVKEGVIVVIFPDSGTKYLSEQPWSNAVSA
ncbi:MAG: cysteine synthase family protein [Ignavibacteriae bacterium]|nr:cysteine synthase family protein [Ignavibacteriota bacterium]